MKLPRVDFPIFEGEHPQVWKNRCEKYFRMYEIPAHLWVHFATVNFKGNAALWLLTYEAQHEIDSWPELFHAVEKKFRRDLYQNYMRDLLAIKQTSDVLEYSERFEQAKHRSLVHNRDIRDKCSLCKNLLMDLSITSVELSPCINRERLMPPCLWLSCRNNCGRNQTQDSTIAVENTAGVL
jgi:hypothetical protein